jgi:eukaryotic-like serine/threonine-protein kinase
LPRDFLRFTGFHATAWRARSVQSGTHEHMPPRELPIVDPAADTDLKLSETSFVDPSDPRRIEMSELRLVAEPALAPQVGSVIGDVYTVDGELGSGAMGIVLAATDRVLGRKVAIKLIRSNLRADDFRERFMLEARAMALVSHPNVVTIHAFGEHEGNPFMVMELVEGQTLDSWLTEQAPYPDVDEALRILNQVCLGVSAIHAAGTLHRDLKPSNVLLDGGLRARVSDLGLAVPFHDDATNKKDVVGTPGYMAPEIHFDVHVDGGATPQSDLYSLACMAFELLTGEPPYLANDDLALAVLHATAAVPAASDVRRDLPRAFDQVLRQALAKDPKQRTQSVELFRRALIEARNDSLEPVRILVAEDDPDFRELLQIVLTQEFPGADIECVADGRKARRSQGSRSVRSPAGLGHGARSADARDGRHGGHRAAAFATAGRAGADHRPQRFGWLQRVAAPGLARRRSLPGQAGEPRRFDQHDTARHSRALQLQRGSCQRVGAQDRRITLKRSAIGSACAGPRCGGPRWPAPLG